METDLHALETSWWPVGKVPQATVPLSSRCYIKNTTQDGLMSVQAAQHICSLPIKWRPIFTVIDLCQLQLQFQKEDGGSHLGKLMVWYDMLRTYIIKEAQREKPASGSLWIPDVVHRFCVRLELGKAHQPKKLKAFEAELRSHYSSRQHWWYDLLSWKQSKEFYWLPQVLKSVDPFSDRSNCTTWLDGFEADCILFGFTNRLEAVAISSVELERVPELELGPGYEHEHEYEQDDNDQGEGEGEAPKRKRGRPRKDKHVELSNDFPKARILRSGERVASCPMDFFQTLPALTGGDVPRKKAMRKRIQANTKPEAEAGVSAKSLPASPGKDFQPSLARRIPSSAIPSVNHPQQKNRNRNLSESLLVGLDPEIEVEKRKRDTKGKGRATDTTLVVDDGHDKLEPEPIPRWVKLLLQPLSGNADDLATHLLDLSDATKGYDKKGIWVDLSHFDVDMIKNLVMEWKKRQDLANFTMFEDNDELVFMKRTFKGIHALIAKGAMHNFHKYVEEMMK